MADLQFSQEKKLPFYKAQNIPDLLKEGKNSVLWMASPRVGNPSKQDKLPIDPSKECLASVTNSHSWGTFAEALSAFERLKGRQATFSTSKGQRQGKISGTGIVMTPKLGLVAVDLDCCFHDNGTLKPWAQDFMDTLNTYTERSPSGKGLRMFVKAKLPKKGMRKGEIELYAEGRFVTLTGDIYGAKKDIESRQSELDKLVEKYFPPKIESTSETTSCEKSPLSDEEIQARLELARRAKNGAKFIALHDEGDSSNYSSQSEAESALCVMYAFWLDKNPVAMDTAFRESALFRPKWDEFRGERTYGEMTIANAISLVKETYSPPQQVEQSEQKGSPSPHVQAAERFLAKYPDTKFHNGFFYMWGERCWVKTDKAEIQRKILLLEAPINRHTSKAFVKNVAEILELLTVTEESFDAHPFRFNFQNESALIDIKQGRIHFTQPEKAHLLSKMNPHEVLVGATSSDAPLFMETCKAWFVNDEDCADKIACLLEALGYCFVNDARLEKFIILLGQGANGKSLFLNLATKILGAENVASVPLSMLGNRFYCAELYGKNANFISELDTFEKSPDGRQKTLASGDNLTADFKYGKPFSFKNTATLVIGCNHLPKVDDFSPAFFRRAIVLGFNRIFAEHEQDKGLLSKLEPEIPAIIGLSLEAIAKAYQRGHFTIPQSGVELVRKWQSEADQIKAFIFEECALIQSAKEQVTELYRQYLHWAQDAGVRRTVTRGGFTKRLAAMGVVSEKSTGGMYFYKGILHGFLDDL